MGCSPPGSSVHGILQARILSGLPLPPPGDLPDPGIEHRSSALQADSLSIQPAGKPLENTTSDFPPLSYERGQAGFQHRLRGPERDPEATGLGLQPRCPYRRLTGSRLPLACPCKWALGRAAFSGCPLFSEDNKTLTHPTNARFNNPKCLQFPYAKQNRPLLPANLKIYTPVFSLRFSTLLPFYHTEAVLVFWSWSRKRQSEVPTDWAHSQTHVIKTRGSVTCCSLLIKKLTTLDTQGSRSFLFLFLLCASMSS